MVLRVVILIQQIVTIFSNFEVSVPNVKKKKKKRQNMRLRLTTIENRDIMKMF